jgi:hypothetical protein
MGVSSDEDISLFVFVWLGDEGERHWVIMDGPVKLASALALSSLLSSSIIWSDAEVDAADMIVCDGLWS